MKTRVYYSVSVITVLAYELKKILYQTLIFAFDTRSLKIEEFKNRLYESDFINLNICFCDGLNDVKGFLTHPIAPLTVHISKITKKGV